MLRTLGAAAVAVWIVGTCAAQAEGRLSAAQARLAEPERPASVLCRPFAARPFKARRIDGVAAPVLPERPVARWAAVDPVVLGVGF